MYIHLILKGWCNAGKNPPVFYYRDKDQHEIDLVLEIDGILYPVEIKKSANPGKDAIGSFRFLGKAAKPTGPGTVIRFASELMPIDRRNSLVPVWML